VFALLNILAEQLDILFGQACSLHLHGEDSHGHLVLNMYIQLWVASALSLCHLQEQYLGHL
jgi:hypothetical protein